MEAVDAPLAKALDRWSVDDEPRDWAVVLRRAARSPAAAHPPFRRFVLAALLLVAALAVAPAFGIVEKIRDFVAGDARPGITLTAPLDGAVSGRFTLFTPSIGIPAESPPRAGKPRIFRPHPVPARQPLEWTLRVDGDVRVLDARLRRGPRRGHGEVLVTLCRPCSTSASGRIRPRRRELFALLGAHVEVRTSRGTATSALLFERHR